MILDYYDDGGELLSELLEESELAKVASRRMGDAVVVDKDDRVRFPDAEFALLRAEKGRSPERFFPVSDLSNTLASVAYFEKTASQLPPRIRDGVEARLIAAMRGHGLLIGGEDDNLPKEASAHEMFDEPVERAPALKHSNFIEIRGDRIGFSTDEQLEKVAHSFADQIGAMSALERRDVALQLKMHGADVPEPLAKYASTDENPSREFFIRRRRKFAETHRTDAVGALDEIAAIDDLEKQASALDMWDRQVRIQRIPDAFRTVFADVDAAPVEAVPEEKLEKIAAIMGGNVRKMVERGKTSQLPAEARRVLSAITEE